MQTNITAPSKWPARRCYADACNQGRRDCPCPEACEVETDEGFGAFEALPAVLKILGGMVAIVGCVLVMAFWGPM
ncbi:MAG: hypothetical protein ACRC1H_02515 [Caldilineaceae bacterium]